MISNCSCKRVLIVDLSGLILSDKSRISLIFLGRDQVGLEMGLSGLTEKIKWQREIMVGKTSLWLVVVKIKKRSSPGSSRFFNRAFWAAVSRFSIDLIRTTREEWLYGLRQRKALMVRIAVILQPLF